MPDNNVSFGILRSIDAATMVVVGQLYPINPLGFFLPPFMIRITNNSNQDCAISFDNINGHEYVPRMSSVTLSFQNNAQPNGFVCLIRRGTVVYASVPAAATGFIYLSTYAQ